jgi:hypothetical protein
MSIVNWLCFNICTLLPVAKLHIGKRCPIYRDTIIVTYITSRPFLIRVGRNHILPLATLLIHTFPFYFHQVSVLLSLLLLSSSFE